MQRPVDTILIVALMLLEMALYTWGFITGQWSRRCYWQTRLPGYGLGLPLVTFVLWTSLIYPFQRIRLVLDHERLAVVGQMVFTNYVMHTLIGTFVCFGYELHQYAE